MRLTIPLGASTATFYFSDAFAELTVLTASEPTVTPATQFAEFYFSDSDGGVDNGGLPGDPDGGPLVPRDGGTGVGGPGTRLEAVDLTVGCDCAHARGAGLLTVIATAWLLLLRAKRSSGR